ncbi:transmembrane protease serine 11D [Fistulifera solaris]|uniref:Transmembrane protease serine 11D n=1 Tax=Fistulifera solaris TaxID=1519565 RepID=A0A1Z5KRB3_FISSO|nr:transmembrane protease serine 11D [Fistulifera solaris]|eukprot:GAX28531.1 transmembrane protease serine 11D [Fistulifera solaris]
MLTFFFFLILSVSHAQQNTENIRELIVGGEEAKEGRFSFAEISLQIRRSHQCGGTLIAPDMILTAAHCQSWIDTAHIHRYDFKNSADVYMEMDPAFIHVHPDFNPSTFQADFSVVGLSKPVPSAQIVRLNTDASVPSANDPVVVIGWGAINITDPSNTIYPNRLQKAHINYITNEDCEKAEVQGQALYTGEIFSNMLCATSPGVDACRGDSGGPLIVEGAVEGEDVQVGIVSWGRGCALFPGVYSRVSDGYDWIRKEVCAFSVDPPAYMRCLDEERDSKFLSPDTIEQSIPSKAPVLHRSSGRVDVEISIQLDLQSHETSWTLSDNDGNVLVHVPYGAYDSFSAQTIDFTVRVDEGSDLFFVIKDEAFNGMSRGVSGWYKIFILSDLQRVEIISGDGDYGRVAFHRFTASLSSTVGDWEQSSNPRDDNGPDVVSGTLLDISRDHTSGTFFHTTGTLLSASLCLIVLGSRCI